MLREGSSCNCPSCPYLDSHAATVARYFSSTGERYVENILLLYSNIRTKKIATAVTSNKYLRLTPRILGILLLHFVLPYISTTLVLSFLFRLIPAFSLYLHPQSFFSTQLRNAIPNC